MTKCRRCIALGITPPGIARKKGLCNWCRMYGDVDNALRARKGLPTYAPLSLLEQALSLFSSGSTLLTPNR